MNNINAENYLNFGGSQEKLLAIYIYRGVESGGAALPQYEKYVFAPPPIIEHIYNTTILNGWLYLK